MDITLFFDLMSIACVLSCVNVISNDKFTLINLYACINITYLKMILSYHKLKWHQPKLQKVYM